MSFLGRLLLGNGTVRPKLKEELEAEGLVLIEEGLSGSVRYEHFNSPFSNPRLGMVDVLREGDDKVVFRVDYDRGDEPKFSGVIKIMASSPNASVIVGQLQERIGR